MQEGPVGINMIKFAIPLALTSILQQLFNSADVAIAGHYVGSDALASVGANSSLINLLINLFVGLSVGSNVIIARLIGMKDFDGVRKSVHTSILVALLAGIFLAIVGWICAVPILTALNTPQEILSQAVLYMRIYFLGMPFTMLYNFASAILRSKGDTKRPLIVLTISGVINVALNLLFVCTFSMGVDGVALATVCATAFSSIVLIVLLCKENSPIHLDLKQLKIHKKYLGKIAQVGIPAGVQGMVFSFSNVMIQSGINSLGKIAMAGATTALNAEYFTYYMAAAFGHAATSFLSQNYGAKNYQRCKIVIKKALLLGTVFTLVWSLPYIIFASEFSSMYSPEKEVIDYAVIRIQLIVTFQCINAAIEIFSGILRSLGYSVVPTIICIIAICGTRLVWLFTIFRIYHTFECLHTCYIASWAITCIALTIAFVIVRKKTYARVEQGNVNC